MTPRATLMVRPARPCNTDNYRHQADVCHAYQVVRAKGIPEDHIIVMAYDDIAQNRQNKFPGKVFNKPTEKGTPGVDVYAGCNINWRGDDVNAGRLLLHRAWFLWLQEVHMLRLRYDMCWYLRLRQAQAGCEARPQIDQ